MSTTKQEVRALSEISSNMPGAQGALGAVMKLATLTRAHRRILSELEAFSEGRAPETLEQWSKENHWCPLHEKDRTGNPNLSVKINEAGQLVPHCTSHDCTSTKAGQRAVLRELGKLGVSVDENGCPTVRPKPDKKPALPVHPAATEAPWVAPSYHDLPLVSAYSYKDAAGKVCGAVARYEGCRPNETVRKKEFVPCFTPAGDGFKAGIPKDARLPLYGLPELLAQPAAPVLVVEGEKTTDALRRRLPDTVVVTCQGSKGGASKTDWAPLANRRVTIWPDRDEAGEQFAQVVAREVKKVGGKIVGYVDSESWELDLPVSGDAVDWLEGQGQGPLTLDALPLRAAEKLLHGELLPRDAITMQDERLVIPYQPGNLAYDVRQVVEMFRTDAQPIFFVRQVELVRVITDAKEVRMQAVTPSGLKYELSLRARYIRPGEPPKAIDPPNEVINAALAPDVVSGWPPLRGVINAPTVTLEGRVIAKAGYDAETGYYVAADYTAAVPAEPEKVTREDAQAAVQKFRELFRETPFEKDSDFAVHLSASLTGLVRPHLRLAPGFYYGAPNQSNGKSFMAGTTVLIVDGRVPPAETNPNSEEESVKKLLSIMKDGQSVVLLDNVVGSFGEDPTLSLVLTSEYYRGRLLGTNHQATYPTRFLLLISGNNIRIVGDMRSRMLGCRLNSGLQNPEDRKFKKAPDEIILRDRTKILRGLLTILLAHRNAGYPGVEKLARGTRFREWDRMVRAAVVWALGVDPADKFLEERNASDQDVATETLLSTVWQSLEKAPDAPLHTVPFQSMDLAYLLFRQGSEREQSLFVRSLHGVVPQELVNCLRVILPEVREDNAVARAGYKMRELVDRPYGDYVLRRVGKGKTGQTYAVECRTTDGTSPDGSGKPSVDNAPPPAPAASMSRVEPLAPATPASPAQKTSLAVDAQVVELERRRTGPVQSMLREAAQSLDDDNTVSYVPAAPWASEDLAVIASLHAAPWKVVDVETTELTPGSPPLKATSLPGLTAWQKSKVDTTPRLRIVTATWPEAAGLRTESWDMDTLSADTRKRLAQAALTGTFVAHNATFDLTWLVHAAGGLAEAPRPDRVVDTLIFARTWAPDQQAALVDAADQETAESELAEAVDTMLGDGRKGGWSLEALVMAHLHKTLDKTLQKPRNWLPPPPLSAAHYQYAAGDSTELLELICALLAGLGFAVEEPTQWLEAYEAWVAEEARRVEENSEPLAPGFDGGAEQLPPADLIALYEQVPWLLAAMSSRGTPADVARKEAYVESQKVAAREAAAQVVAVAPELARFEEQLADIRQGQSAVLKQALGEAFVKRGLTVSRTEKTRQYQVGQKDLRGAGATQSEATRPLFEALVATYNASRRASMAEDMFAFATRSDGRIHALFSPKTATLRLASSEPNNQQSPADALFRAITKAHEGHKIVACDFSALDVRVGAALAVRAQHQVFAANGENRFDWQGLQTVVSAPVARQLEELSQWPSAQLAREATRKGEALWDMLKARKTWREARERGLKQGLDDAALRTQSPYGKILERYEEAAQRFLAIELLAHWDRICTEVQARDTDAFSPLRQAFLFGADIHTYTALLLQGHDPEEMLAGLKDAALKARLKELKGELGDARKEGKVANLSLLYGMSAYGFQHHAASLWDIHWTKEEAEKLRDGWLNAYVEIAFFAAVVRSHEWLPRPWECHTLTGRVLYAPAYSAALNYPDQGTGADIALAAMARLDAQYPEVGHCLINQVHDELVLETPAEKAESYARILHDVMVEEGNRVLMPYGVPMAAEYVIADEWQKG